MARLARLEAPGHSHLAMQPLLPGRVLVADEADAARWCDALRDLAAAEQVQVLAWAVAPAAVWLLLTTESTGALGRFVQGLGRRYVAAQNRRLGLSGPAWAGRYRAAVVEPGPWRLDATLWVDLLGSSPSLGSGPWRTGALARPPWLADPPELWALGNTPFEREALWRKRLADGLPNARAEALARSSAGNWVAGSAAFAAALAESLGRATRPRPRGRPMIRPQ